MLLNAERLMLIHIAKTGTVGYPESAVGYFREDAQQTFRHLHKDGLLSPSDDNLFYHINERGHAELKASEPTHRALFDYTRDSKETW